MPATVGLSFAPGLFPEFCDVYVTVSGFAPSTLYTTTYTAYPAPGPSYSGPGSSITTDVNGNAGPVRVLNSLNEGFGVVITIDGISSEQVTTICS